MKGQIEAWGGGASSTAVAQGRWPPSSSAGSSRPPCHVNRKGVWTFALSRSVHHPANGAHQPHGGGRGGERGGRLAEVGAERWGGRLVAEHLTQAPFVLWAGVCITSAEVCGGQSGWNGWGVLHAAEDHSVEAITTWSLSCSNRWSAIFAFKVSPGLHFLLNNSPLCCERPPIVQT